MRVVYRGTHSNHTESAHPGLVSKLAQTVFLAQTRKPQPLPFGNDADDNTPQAPRTVRVLSRYYQESKGTLKVFSQDTLTLLSQGTLKVL